jgi:hypothetical protein
MMTFVLAQLAWSAPDATPVPSAPASSAPAAGPSAPVEAHRFRWGTPATHFETWGHLREIGQLRPNISTDSEGGVVGQGPVLDQRLRLGAAARFVGLRLATEWDVATGQAAGDTWDLPVSIDPLQRDELAAWTTDGVVPRRISLSAPLKRNGKPVGEVEVGLVPALTWGLGILANGGERTTPFGRVDRGDRMIRLKAAWQPSDKVPLSLIGAFDAVVEDDTAHLSRGQRAYHAVGAALYKDPKGGRLGLFTTARLQFEDSDVQRATRVLATDLFGELPLDLGGWNLRIAGEGVLVLGSTRRALSMSDLDRTAVRSGAAAGEIELSTPNKQGSLLIQTGWTSATGDPDAGVNSDLALDSNYNVGLVLFDEIGSAIEAGTYAQLNDPDNAGRAPYGAEALVTGGSVKRAAYLAPSVKANLADFGEVRLGWMGAWATGPIAQPFYTFRAGGSPRNQLDEPTTGRWMGHEVDAAVSFGTGPRTLGWWFRPQLGLQGGLAFPSAALGGGVKSTVLATAQLSW